MMPDSSKDAFIGFRCSPRAKAQAEQEAEDKGISLSDLMRKRIEDLDAGDEAASAYLDLFGPPALANTADTYFQTFAAVRSVLEGAGIGHASAALDAAQDATEQHVDRHLSRNGSGREENSNGGDHNE